MCGGGLGRTFCLELAEILFLVFLVLSKDEMHYIIMSPGYHPWVIWGARDGVAIRRVSVIT